MLTDLSIALNASIGRQRSLSPDTPSEVVSFPSSGPAALQVVGNTAVTADQAVQKAAAQQQTLPGGGNTPAGGELKKAVSDINAFVQNLQRDIQFKVDEKLGLTIITIVDSKTNEVVRQIPSEQAIATAHHLQEFLNRETDTGGLLFKAKT